VTITRADVADLRPGDVVEITSTYNGSVYTHRGPVVQDGRGVGLLFETYWVRTRSGDAPQWIDSLTVVSRAPRPLYVNHDRAEPVPGDVVRDADDDSDTRTWMCFDRAAVNGWVGRRGSNSAWCTAMPRADLPDRLRLLADGETGQVVP
jgi:hypothetical protein